MSPDATIRPFVLGLGLVLVLAGAGSALAKAKHDSVHVSVSPAHGDPGTKYTVTVRGTAVSKESLILAMAKKGLACPQSYARGLKSLYGIASVKGKTVQPADVHGKVAMTVHARLGAAKPGRYRICAYLNNGRKTLALGSAQFTVTH